VGTLIPGCTPQVVQRIRRGLDDSRLVMLDVSCTAKDGRKFAAEVSISAIDLTNPGDLVFTVRNTEPRRRRLEMLRSKENAFEAAHSAMFVCGEGGEFLFVNKAFREMFGLEEDEAQKLFFTDVFDDAPLPEFFDKALKEGVEGSVRLTVENEDGTEELDIRIAPDTRSSKISGVVGSVSRV
ncbi:MAG: PAS domain S-box protein, partial [Kiritimatiellae bacterium]|nr:PAS domain S-box protein [Kiritimatiellia bacterium]